MRVYIVEISNKNDAFDVKHESQNQLEIVSRWLTIYGGTRCVSEDFSATILMDWMRFAMYIFLSWQFVGKILFFFIYSAEHSKYYIHIITWQQNILHIIFILLHDTIKKQTPK